MRLVPKGVADIDPIIRWVIELRLQHIEEVAFGPQAPGISTEAAKEAILRSLGRDGKADEKVVVDAMRADLRGWWQGFSERRFLIDLYRRARPTERGIRLSLQ